MALSLTKKDKQGIAMGAFAFLTIGAMFGVYLWLQRQAAYDEETLCPLNISYNSTIILIDKSDPWKAQDAKKIVSLILEVADSLEKYERLQLYVIHAEEHNGEPHVETHFDMCNPGSKANPFYANPRKAKARYDEMFKEPLEKVVKVLTRPGQANRTPLLHAITTVVDESEAVNKRIIIISDLFENTQRFNFYKESPDIDEILGIYHLNGKGIRSITIKYIRRNNVTARLEARAKQIFKDIAERINATFKIDNFLEI